MPKINLAQEVVRNQVIARRRRLLYGLSIVILLLTIAAWGAVLFLTTQLQTRIDTAQGEVRRLEAQLAEREDDVREVVLFRERLKSLQKHLATHVLWSRVLEEFERLTTPATTFFSMKGNVQTQSIIADLRIPSLDAGADLVAAFQSLGDSHQTFFPSVIVTSLKAIEAASQPGVSTSVSGYMMQLRLSASESAFRAPESTQGTSPNRPSSPSGVVPSPEL